MTLPSAIPGPAWRTRFGGWRAAPARMVLALLALLCGLGLLISMTPLPPRAAVDPERGDAALYRAIVGRMTAGESYYTAAAAEQRLRHYPLRPFITVRPPLLAEALASLGMPLAGVVLRLLAVGVFAALAMRLRRGTLPGLTQATVLIIAAAGLVAASRPDVLVWHEGWAALLIALSLPCRSPRVWVPSLALGIAAALMRELAIPYLLVMATVAAWERRTVEALAWAGGIAVALAGLALHAAEVAAHVTAADAASPGWMGAQGWRLVLAMADATSLLSPVAVATLAVPLALLGWCAWPGGLGRRGALLLGGYALAFMVLGRADNNYWGLIFAPLLPLGLAVAPAALRDLWQAAAPRARAAAPA